MERSRDTPTVSTGDARLVYAKSACLGCGTSVFHVPGWPEPQCLDCSRSRYRLDDRLWFKPVGAWHPTIPRVEVDPMSMIKPRPRSTPAATRAQTVVLKRGTVVDPTDPVVPADARRLVLAGLEAHPEWRVKLTHSVTLNEAGNAVVHHVFIRVYRRGDGEPLGYCGWSAGHTTGGRIWNYRPDSALRFSMVNSTEFACWLRGEAYLPPGPARRGACPVCSAEVRVKKNGTPYAHRHAITDELCLWRIPYRLIEGT